MPRFSIPDVAMLDAELSGMPGDKFAATVVSDQPNTATHGLIFIRVE